MAENGDNGLGCLFMAAVMLAFGAVCFIFAFLHGIFGDVLGAVLTVLLLGTPVVLFFGMKLAHDPTNTSTRNILILISIVLLTLAAFFGYVNSPL